MKLFFAMLLISLNALGMDVCSFQGTSDFRHALKTEGIKPVRVSKNHKKFDSFEKRLIQKTAESLINLNEKGEIIYYNFEGTQLILVRFYPDESEYGAFYGINKNGSVKTIAQVSESYIYCK